MGAARLSSSVEDPCPKQYGGQFYYNPEDSSMFAQTRIGHSYTLNLANRASWVLVGLTISYLAAMMLLARTIWSS